MPKDRDKDV